MYVHFLELSGADYITIAAIHPPEQCSLYDLAFMDIKGIAKRSRLFWVHPTGGVNRTDMWQPRVRFCIFPMCVCVM